jgi:RNA 2',3'-cyclic 3'-phosphodiesterase
VLHLDERVDVPRSALPDLRWVPAGRWHITLEFLGECGRHEADRQLARWSRRAARVGPFDLSLAGAGAFPRAWKARVLYAGVRTDSDAWRRLAVASQVPHVTLARTRQTQDLTGLVDCLSTYSGPAWRVEQVALMASYLRGSGDRGPRYEPVEMLELGPA